mmetsp:Transcript_36349/g.79138  ORF Transcript_36349/g.79138 Transcript_36349/m.79138 type:complete len:80 (-) Transcript_36349:2806-3045(-)
MTMPEHINQLHPRPEECPHTKSARPLNNFPPGDKNADKGEDKCSASQPKCQARFLPNKDIVGESNNNDNKLENRLNLDI